MTGQLCYIDSLHRINPTALAIPMFKFTLRCLFWTSCCAITIASIAPAEYLPGIAFSWWDKAQHAVAFCFLGTLGVAAYSQSPRAGVLFGLLGLGAGIEIVQWASGWRDGDIADLAADGVGLILAALIFHLANTLFLRVAQKKPQPR